MTNKVFGKKININIEKNEFTFIDGSNGKELTKEEFDGKYKKLGRPNLGGLGTKISAEGKEGKA